MNDSNMSDTKKTDPCVEAANNMDWVQVVLNGGPPCFHLCEDGRFCGRAERWEGHGEKDFHGFVSLAQMIILRDVRCYAVGDGIQFDQRLVDMNLFAWVGEDELGSGSVGIKQAIVPAGCIPIVACDKSKVDAKAVRLQMQIQAKQYHKTISLVRFCFERVEEQVS